MGEKSQAIREYIGLNPTAKHSDVVKALQEKGITVSLQTVIAARKPPKQVIKFTGSFGLEEAQTVKSLVNKLGKDGLKQLVELVS